MTKINLCRKAPRNTQKKKLLEHMLLYCRYKRTEITYTTTTTINETEIQINTNKKLGVTAMALAALEEDSFDNDYL